MSSAKPVSPAKLLELRRLMLESARLLPAKLSYDAAEAKVTALVRELQFEAGMPHSATLNEDGTWVGKPLELSTHEGA